MNKKLAVLILALTTVVSAAYAVTTPAKSVVNPITQMLYVPDNGSAPARIRVYRRVESSSTSGWTEDTAHTITAPSTTAKTFGMAMDPNGSYLYVSYANMNYSRLMIYPLDAQGNPGVGFSSDWVADSYASPAGVCYAGNRIYMADPGDGVVHVFNLQNGSPVYAGDLTDHLDGLSGIYDVAVTAPVNGAYKLFVSRKANSSTTDELFMYTVSNTGTITFTSSASLQFPTYMKVVGNNLYVAANGDDGIAIRGFDVSGNVLQATSVVTTGVAGGWVGFDISKDGKWLYLTHAQDMNETSTKFYRVSLPISGTVGASLISGCLKSDGLVISPDGARMALTYSGAGTVINSGDSVLTFLKPTFTSITPTATTYGVPVTVTITGGNFFNSPAVQTIPILMDTYHGSNTNYTLTNIVYQSPTQMTATANGTSAWQASYYALEIANQDVGGTLPNYTTYYVSPGVKDFAVNFTPPQGLQGFAYDTASNALPGGSLRWTWTANNQGEEYSALVDGSGNVIMDTLTTPTYTENQILNPNTQYTRKARAYMRNGLYTDGPAVTQYSSAAIPSPADPTATSTAVSLNWASGGNPSGTTYQVWRKTASSAYAQVTSTTAGSFSDTNVTSGTTYTYKVRAVNFSNTPGQFSYEVSILVPVPAQAPNYPSTFQQFKADGVTSLANGGTVAAGSNVVVKFTVSGTSNPQTIIPYVRFDGGASSALPPVTYTGTPITVSYTATNLAAGSHNWDALAMDSPSYLQTAWISSGLTFVVGAPAPTVSAIMPTSGAQGATNLGVSLAGGNFANGATVQLTKAGQTAISVTITYISSLTMTGKINIPAAAALGAWNVVVTNSDGQSATLSNGFTVTASTAPTINTNGITPSSTNEGFTVNITNLSGTNFADHATVQLTNGGSTINMTSVSVLSSTWINGIFVIPLAGPAGPWNVVVTNPDGQSGTLTNGFTVLAALPAPTIASIDPNNGVAGSSVRIVNLIGTNFLPGAIVSLESSAGTVIAGATNVKLYSSTVISCDILIPAGTAAGTYSIVVTNPDTQSAGAAFKVDSNNPVTAPTISAITPAKGQIGKTAVITNLAGTNFAAGATVKLAKTGQTDITMDMTNATITPTKISGGSFVIPANAQTGLWTVMVTNLDTQTGQLIDGFNVTTEAVSTGAITNSSITRDADTVGSSVTVSWQTDTANASVDVYALTGTFTTDAAGGWTKTADSTNITTNKFTDANQVGTGTAKYYKIMPTGATLQNSDLTQEVVGKFDLSVGPSDTQPERALISLPLQTTSTNITSVFGTQPQENDAIAVIDNNFAIVSGKIYTGGSWQDIQGTPGLNDLNQGYAFVYTTLTPKYMTVVGKVLETSNTRSIVGGTDANGPKLSWIANSLPMPVMVSDVKTGLNGLSSGADATVGAQTALIDANASIIGNNYALHNAPATWVDTNTQSSTMVLQPGRGYMLTEPTITNYSWTQSR
jgi:hypothetical protein